MKKLLVLAVAVIAAISATGASAQKGGPASVLNGAQGVASPDGKVRYVALTTGRQTLVSVIRVRGGQVVRWRFVRGFVGVPIVGLDGTTDGVSRDGRTLVLASTPEVSTTGGVVTRFAAIDTRNLRLRQIKLRGSWSYDALSPDASMLYLVQYSGAGSTAAYQVRAFDLRAHRLLARPIVDRRIGERLMRGQAVTRETSSNGRWAYTLYARQRLVPFVHALDTVQQRAYCVDLPLELRRPAQMGLRLALERDELAVRNAGATVAVVDTRTFQVRRS